MCLALSRRLLLLLLQLLLLEKALGGFGRLNTRQQSLGAVVGCRVSGKD